jgi:predicted RNA-binding protein with PIN domain
MRYLVDGHNLIPAMGLQLDSADDEQDLLKRLQEFTRLSRAEMEVYFDGAPQGNAGTRRVGTLKVHFIRRGASADSAIEQRLLKMRKSAREWTVVSSDRRVRSAATEAGAKSMDSPSFALLVRQTGAISAGKKSEEPSISKEEVDEFLVMFKNRNKDV